MRSTRLLITLAIWAFVPGLHANDSAHCSDDGVLLRFQDDLMIQVDDGFEGLRVTTPGAASAALAAEWCAARPSIATRIVALNPAVETMTAIEEAFYMLQSFVEAHEHAAVEVARFFGDITDGDNLEDAVGTSLPHGGIQTEARGHPRGEKFRNARCFF